MENKLILSLGSNLGNRKINMEKAIVQLENQLLEVEVVSSFYETEAWGNEKLNAFYNIAIKGITKASLEDCLRIVKAIEEEMGRVQSKSNSYENRIIDIDILFYNQEVLRKEDLIVPHPRLHLRNFVLDPLMEIDQDFLHPLYLKTIGELKAECEDKQNSIRISTV
jgi:2-amino-4-hydroxy-6-hydroxymethyldihydropteridine diphosphokinase